jgi:GNAT superfamily N-acetyltransferase
VTDVDLRIHDGRAPLGMLEELADLYERVYVEPPYNSAPKFSRARFLQRTGDQAQSPGFTLITAHQDEHLVGLAFGFSMAPGRWWGSASSPPQEVLNASKFAVIELLVDRQQRGHGLGQALLDALLQERPESVATLAAVIEADAYDWYLRRGWRKVAEFRVEPPYSDALALDLQRA